MERLLQIKITLKHSKPEVWRRLLISDKINFLQLHEIIQDSMIWENCHLYEFDLGVDRIGIANEEDETIDSSQVKLSDYFNKKGAKMRYVYDFGDYWEHSIELEGFAKMEKGKFYPECIDGENSCPPEDCGGIPGYYFMLQIINDKKHPEHLEMTEWLGYDFDPKSFSKEFVNDLLKSH